jgi:photosystem II stability/assembly factor-like uncharacterized protein
MVDIEFTDSLHGWAVGNGDNGSTFISLFAKTTDGGETWESTVMNVPFLNSISFSDNLNGWMCGDHGAILSTSDGGLNWSQITYHQYVYFNSVYFIDSNHGWIVGEGPVNGGSFGGIAIYTDDGGQTWQRKDVGVGRELLSVFFTDNEFGYATGVEGTVLKWGENYVGVENHESSTIDHSFDLFPNPANDHITIETPTHGQLTIINLQGQEFLSQKITDAKARIDINTLPSGVYLVKLVGEKGVQVGKFVKQ